MGHKHFRNFIIALVLLFLYLPIIVLIIFSFNQSKLNILFTGFTFKWYGVLIHNRDLLKALGNTLIVSSIATIVSTIIGTISAIGLEKYSFKGKNLINELLYIPIVIPEIVLGIALLSVFSLVHIELGMFTLIISHIAFCIPFVIISVRSVLKSLSPNLEEAAHDLGATKMQTFWNVVLPSIKPGIISGALLSLTLSLDDVVVSYFTAGPGSNTLPLKIFSMIKTGVTPDVNALSTIIILVTFTTLLVITLIQFKAMKKEARG